MPLNLGDKILLHVHHRDFMTAQNLRTPSYALQIYADSETLPIFSGTVSGP